MKTIVCKHEVHQVRQQGDSSCYDLVLSVIEALMSDVNEATAQISQELRREMSESDFSQRVGSLDTYAKIWDDLKQWKVILSQQAGIPLPSFEEEVAECC